MSEKILFLDIDGVFIPGRCYHMAHQSKPIVTEFDPSVVGMVNELCYKFGYKLVIHSSWLRTNLQFLYHKFDGEDPTTHEWMILQGLKREYFHEDHSCQWRFSGNRWMAIHDWLQDHPDVKNYFILEDEPCYYHLDYSLNKDWIIQTDFDEGLTYAQFRRIAEANDPLCSPVPEDGLR